jgi:hypothetical protein
LRKAVQNSRQGMFCRHPHRAPVEISIDRMIFSGYCKQEGGGQLMEEPASRSRNQIGMISEKPQFAYGVERHLCETRWSSLHSIFNIQKIFPGLRTVDRKKPSSLTETCQASCARREPAAWLIRMEWMTLHYTHHLRSAECLASPSPRVGGSRMRYGYRPLAMWSARRFLCQLRWDKLEQEEL